MQSALLALELEPQVAPPTPRQFEPYVSIEVENAQYILKTVNRISEFREVLKLRGQVYGEEYGAQMGTGPTSSAFDVDEYDFQCDHLVILEKSTQAVVGTYRMLCSQFTNRFYSETEFNLDSFLATPEVKLELGRACIHRDHRKGTVLSLLWRGLIRYAIHVKAEYLFGCSSVKGDRPEIARTVSSRLERKNHISTQWIIQPLAPYQIPHFSSLEEHVQGAVLPSLFRSYLSAGAKVYGEPAWDQAFHCFDYLTILKISDLAGAYEKRFQT